MDKENNNIIFRPSWFKTLNRWEPEMVKEFITALDNFYNNTPYQIKNDRVLDLWEQAHPLLEGDRDKYKKRTEVAKANGSLGGAPKGNKNATKTTENNPIQPKTSKDNQEQPKTSKNNLKQAKQPIEKEIEIENEIEIESDIENNTNSYDNNEFLENSLLSNKETNLRTNTQAREDEYSTPLYLQEPTGEVLEYLKGKVG